MLRSLEPLNEFLYKQRRPLQQGLPQLLILAPTLTTQLTRIIILAWLLLILTRIICIEAQHHT